MKKITEGQYVRIYNFSGYSFGKVLEVNEKNLLVLSRGSQNPSLYTLRNDSSFVKKGYSKDERNFGGYILNK